MPDAGATATTFPLSEKQDRGRAELGAFIGGLPGSARPLGGSELNVYRSRGPLFGWRLQVQVAGEIRALDVLADTAFPYSPPRVALVDLPPPLTWPHVEDDGVLCLLTSASSVDPYAPGDVAKRVLGDACQLIEDCVAGRNEEDFRAEFVSYWNRAVTDGSTPVRSLVSLRPPTRGVAVWRGKSFYLVGDDDSSVARWLKSFFRESNRVDRIMERAAFLWLEKPLLPREYPRNAADVMQIAHNSVGPSAVALLEEIARGSPAHVVVLMGAPTQTGACVAAVTLLKPKAASNPSGRQPDALTRGFRPGKVPSSVVLHRYFGSQALSRSKTARVDGAWVHGRDQEMRLPTLRAAKIVVIGCGSVGAPVALRLAEAGVGRLVLIDQGILEWANVGRHPLGAGHVGQQKATALATKIKADYPHINSVDAYPSRWQHVAEQHPAIFDDATLIASVTGDWSADAALNDWHLARGRRPTVIYGWTEPHACAGHAVLILNSSSNGCLRCGFTGVGEPLLRVTEWPPSSAVTQEPACGAVFQPYGPIELMQTEALIAEASLDAILGDPAADMRHRIWVGQARRLAEAGGCWTSAWLNVARNAEGNFCQHRDWPRQPDCPACSQHAA